MEEMRQRCPRCRVLTTGSMNDLLEPSDLCEDCAAEDEEKTTLTAQGGGPQPSGDLTMAKQPTRPERWAEALDMAKQGVNELLELQAEYQDWQDNLPESFDMEPVGERLESVVGLDLKGAAAILKQAGEINLPLGFGRDDE